MKHPSGIDPSVVAKVVARRGRLHAFETLVPAETALVVVDLNIASVEQDQACRPIIDRINLLARTLRDRGGLVAWILPDFEITPRAVAIHGAARARSIAEAFEGRSGALWPGLEPHPDDLTLRKRGASALFPGAGELHEKLTDRSVENVLVAGTVTNVCCETTARDAVALGYRTTMISDCCAGHAFGLHEASLATFYRSLGDVRPAHDVIALLSLAS